MRRVILQGVLIFVFILALGGQCSATPTFSTDEGEACAFCHSSVPQLNEAGEFYKEHGSLEGYAAEDAAAEKQELGAGVVNVDSTRHFGENCQACHVDRKDEWLESKHSISYNGGYQESISGLSNEDKENCKQCHVTRIGDEVIESVTCVACHSAPDTVVIEDPVEVCRRCHSKVDGQMEKDRGEFTTRMNNEFERWSFAKHSNATDRLLESAEYNALETNSQKILCLACHSTDFRLVQGEIKIVDGDIGCVACHGGINPQEEFKKVEEGEFDNYATARRNSLKNVDHAYSVPSADICGNCHTGPHHPQYEIWQTGEHASVPCVKCHGETVSDETHESDMDHTFMVNFNACDQCHDATTRIDKWGSLEDMELDALRAYYKADGKLDAAIDLGVTMVYVGETRRSLDKALQQLGIARNAYFHNQKQMREALTNATVLSEEAAAAVETSILEFKTTMKTVAIITTVLIAGAVAAVMVIVIMWREDHRRIIPVKTFARKLRNIRSLPTGEKRKYIVGVSAVVAFLLVFNVGFLWVSNQPFFCTNCHIMQPMYDTWTESPHNEVNCHECHIETRLQSAMKGFNYGSALVYGRYAATGTPEVPKEICKECHELDQLKPEHLISSDAHMIHPSYFDCNTCHKTHLVTVDEGTCISCHVPGYTRVIDSDAE